jgi:catechol 2,3-dioxygenase-like lactoylglutathione lyase family enzyme
MSIQAKYVHTNLIAKNWRSLADFYSRVFGCVVIPPERNLKGEALEKGTGIPGAQLQGVHLSLPGYAEGGPTLEIYTYTEMAEEGTRAVNRPGYGHIAFLVEDVTRARVFILAAGGSTLGEVVTTQVGSDRQITWCYMADPEGNGIELQSWGKA